MMKQRANAQAGFVVKRRSNLPNWTVDQLRAAFEEDLHPEEEGTGKVVNSGSMRFKPESNLIESRSDSGSDFGESRLHEVRLVVLDLGT